MPEPEEPTQQRTRRNRSAHHYCYNNEAIKEYQERDIQQLRTSTARAGLDERHKLILDAWLERKQQIYREITNDTVYYNKNKINLTWTTREVNEASAIRVPTIFTGVDKTTKVNELKGTDKKQYVARRKAWTKFIRAEEMVQNGNFLEHYRRLRAASVHIRDQRVLKLQDTPGKIKKAIETLREAAANSEVSTPQEEYVLQERTEPIMEEIDEFENEPELDTMSSSEGEDIQDEILWYHLYID